MVGRKKMNKWSIFEVIWPIIAIGTVVFIALTSKSDSIIEISASIAAICGVTYAILIAKQDKKAYLFGVINVLCYAFASFSKELYANAAYNVFYSFPMMIYGFIYWKRNEKSKDLGIRSLSKKAKIFIGVCLVIAIIMMSALLKYFGGRMYVLDATISVTVMLATYFMTNKFMEQWPVWIMGNIAGMVMWGILTFEDISNLSLFVMWVLYTLNSLYGFLNWRRIRNLKEG